MRTKALVSAASFALLIAGAAPAYADDAARAAELFATGNKLFDEQKWAEAEASYQAAWDLRKSFDLAGNLGDVEMTLGQYRDAAEHLSYALEEFPAGGKPEVREALQKRLEEAKKQVGSVTIGTSIGGAKIYVDGRFVGQAPLAKPVFVDPGKRVIEARLPGHDDVLKTVDVEKAQAQEVSLVLAPKIGGSSGGKSKILIGVGGGLALVGIGAGIGLLATASGLSSDADAQDNAMPDAACNPLHPRNAEFSGACVELRGTLERSQTLHNVGIGALVVGGVIGVGTLVYALMPSKKSATMGLQVLPTVAPTYAGLSAIGRF
ncbi:PEGA domain-containing protein [Polyangium sp. 6x1]|uniref:PEGA domain-containing protein n=1 Tax=Polyangium sp. 6x1 TaxID=3042689 RepID=UPI002482A395|nr:PEGA domain-containing protein [Polyangium sp. 6x1]MDI1447197.1 PEGA domain-containing protein [Polyangium sp. 6x1]